MNTFQHLTWKEAAEAIGRGAVMILPVGSTEAHGPHLPLATDVIISEEMSRRAAGKLRCLYVALQTGGTARGRRQFAS